MKVSSYGEEVADHTDHEFDPYDEDLRRWLLINKIRSRYTREVDDGNSVFITFLIHVVF